MLGGGGGWWFRWKQELLCIRSFFMRSLWHQEHLAVASSAPRAVTSNGLLRASQGDYLCTISGSLWSLCDNSILSWLHSGGGWVPWAVAFPRGVLLLLRSNSSTSLPLSNSGVFFQRDNWEVLIPPFHQKNACLWRNRTRLNRAFSTPAPLKTGKVLICHRRCLVFPRDPGVRLVLFFSIDFPMLNYFAG